MEMNTFLQTLSNYLPNVELSENQYFKDFIRNRDLIKAEEFSDQLVMTLPSPRINWYASSDFDGIQKGVTKYVGSFLNVLGFYPVYS
jgi:hypothetical protein